MSKSIPLKEIVGFLPYGLKVMHTDFEPEGAFTQEAEIETISTECICFKSKWSASDYYFDDPDCEIKPAVRQLSDLTKEINHNGETFVPIVELLKIRYKGFYEHNLGSRYAEAETTNHNNYAEAYFSFHAVFSIKVWYLSLKDEPSWVVDKLKEWHFDVYDWIKDGKAIDVNTI